ncbi:unnamed protein product [Vitrella brassicaformis CCMP3155]|uniref:adenosine deaminase n=1 Tax=Vitrella brassicaformis (strain CCMP3155) TaxID=1169540 RepID=A0A0G4GFU4_VITBC|nr:unnamed protein product [Vitrella brassicaformis CCMP3155]|eukprot:CEM28393.1 unnamed protein product [Vitrella brassicaformis CCMP3155]
MNSTEALQSDPHCNAAVADGAEPQPAEADEAGAAHDRERFRGIPKIEVCCVIEAAVRLERLVREYQRLGLQLPDDEEERRRFFTAMLPQEDPVYSLALAFTRTQQIFDSMEVLREVTAEVVEDRYREESVVALELRFWPKLFTHIYGHSYEEVMGAIQQGVEEGRRRCDSEIEVGLMVCAIAGGGEEQFVDTINFAVTYKEAVVGVVVDASEPELLQYLHHLDSVHAAGLKISLKLEEPRDDAASVLSQIRPSRICDSTVIHNPAALDMIRQNRIALELTPAESESDREYVKWLFDHQFSISVNSEFPVVRGTSLTAQFERLAAEEGWTLDQLARMNYRAIAGSFLPEEAKQRVRHQWFRHRGDHQQQQPDDGQLPAPDLDRHSDDDQSEPHDSDCQQVPQSEPPSYSSAGGPPSPMRDARSPSPPRSPSSPRRQPHSRLQDQTPPPHRENHGNRQQLGGETGAGSVAIPNITPPRSPGRDEGDGDENESSHDGIGAGDGRGMENEGFIDDDELEEEGGYRTPTNNVIMPTANDGFNDPFQTPPQCQQPPTPTLAAFGADDDGDDEDDDDEQEEEANGVEGGESESEEEEEEEEDDDTAEEEDTRRLATAVYGCISSEMARIAQCVVHCLAAELLRRCLNEAVQRQLELHKAALLAMQLGAAVGRHGGGGGGREENEGTQEAVEVDDVQLTGQKRPCDGNGDEPRHRPLKRRRRHHHSRRGCKRKRLDGHIAGPPLKKQRVAPGQQQQEGPDEQQQERPGQQRLEEDAGGANPIAEANSPKPSSGREENGKVEEAENEAIEVDDVQLRGQKRPCDGDADGDEPSRRPLKRRRQHHSRRGCKRKRLDGHIAGPPLKKQRVAPVEREEEMGEPNEVKEEEEEHHEPGQEQQEGPGQPQLEEDVAHEPGQQQQEGPGQPQLEEDAGGANPIEEPNNPNPIPPAPSKAKKRRREEEVLKEAFKGSGYWNRSSSNDNEEGGEAKGRPPYRLRRRHK